MSLRILAVVFGLILAAMIGGLVWLFTVAPIATIILCAVVAALLAVELRHALRPSPFGGYAKPERDPCPHCGAHIEHDDAVRMMPGHLPMHERCARERQAVGHG